MRKCYVSFLTLLLSACGVVDDQPISPGSGKGEFTGPTIVLTADQMNQGNYNHGATTNGRIDCAGAETCRYRFPLVEQRTGLFDYPIFFLVQLLEHDPYDGTREVPVDRCLTDWLWAQKPDGGDRHNWNVYHSDFASAFAKVTAGRTHYRGIVVPDTRQTDKWWIDVEIAEGADCKLAEHKLRLRVLQYEGEFVRAAHPAL